MAMFAMKTRVALRMTVCPRDVRLRSLADMSTATGHVRSTMGGAVVHLRYRPKANMATRFCTNRRTKEPAKKFEDLTRSPSVCESHHRLHQHRGTALQTIG